MSPLIIPIFDFVTDVIGKFIPDPQKKAEMQLEVLKLDQQGKFKELEVQIAQIAGQLDVDKIEAANSSLFVSGWRPFIGWICGSGLAIQFVVSPIATFVADLFGKVVELPQLNLETLMTLLFGMLGLGAYRTMEKIKGAA